MPKLQKPQTDIPIPISNFNINGVIRSFNVHSQLLIIIELQYTTKVRDPT